MSVLSTEEEEEAHAQTALLSAHTLPEQGSELERISVQFLAGAVLERAKGCLAWHLPLLAGKEVS